MTGYEGGYGSQGSTKIWNWNLFLMTYIIFMFLSNILDQYGSGQKFQPYNGYGDDYGSTNNLYQGKSI